MQNGFFDLSISSIYYLTTTLRDIVSPATT